MNLSPTHRQNRMDDKLTILTESLPKAVLQAQNPETAGAVPHGLFRGDLIVISRFPFRIGRESRVVRVDGRLERIERPKKDDSPPNNDLYLVDCGQRLNISREHCQIEKRAGGYFLVDRGSACGTKIDGVNVGGDDVGGEAELHDGDLIAMGAVGTPYIFRFITFDEYSLVRREE